MRTFRHIELNPTNTAIIGQTLRDHRNYKKLPGRAVAKRMGVEVSSLYRFERGLLAPFPSTEAIIKIVTFLDNLTIEDLFKGCTTIENPKHTIYDVIYTKDYFYCYNHALDIPDNTMTALTTDDHIKSAINPTIEKILKDMQDVHKSMSRLETSMTYILRAVYSNSVGLPMPDEPVLDEDKF